MVSQLGTCFTKNYDAPKKGSVRNKETVKHKTDKIPPNSHLQMSNRDLPVSFIIIVEPFVTLSNILMKLASKSVIKQKGYTT